MFGGFQSIVGREWMAGDGARRLGVGGVVDGGYADAGRGGVEGLRAVHADFGGGCAGWREGEGSHGDGELLGSRDVRVMNAVKIVRRVSGLDERLKGDLVGRVTRYRALWMRLRW